ncbi:MAG: pentapeptide repeat-containing protein [Actinomycetota bacterium]
MLPPRLPESLVDDEPAPLAEEVVWEGLRVTGDHNGVEAAYVELIECLLVDMQLTAARLDRPEMRDCRLERVEASGALLAEARLRRVEMIGCRLSGVDLGAARFVDVRFVDCRLDEVNLRMTKGERVEFEGCDLRGAELNEAELPGTRFLDCDLSGAQLAKADLRGGSIVGSTIDELRGVQQLRGVTIDPMQVIPLGVRLLDELGVIVDDGDDAAS